MARSASNPQQQEKQLDSFLRTSRKVKELLALVPTPEPKTAALERQVDVLKLKLEREQEFGQGLVRTLQQIKDQNEQEFQTRRKQWEQELQQQKQQHTDQLDSVQKEQAERLGSLERNFEEQKAALVRQQTDALQAFRQQQQESIQAMTREHEEIVTRQQEEYSNLQKDFNNLVKTKDDLEQTTGNLEREVQSLRQQLEERSALIDAETSSAACNNNDRQDDHGNAMEEDQVEDMAVENANEGEDDDDETLKRQEESLYDKSQQLQSSIDASRKELTTISQVVEVLQTAVEEAPSQNASEMAANDGAAMGGVDNREKQKSSLKSLKSEVLSNLQLLEKTSAVVANVQQELTAGATVLAADDKKDEEMNVDETNTNTRDIPPQEATEGQEQTEDSGVGEEEQAVSNEAPAGEMEQADAPEKERGQHKEVHQMEKDGEGEQPVQSNVADNHQDLVVTHHEQEHAKVTDAAAEHQVDQSEAEQGVREEQRIALKEPVGKTEAEYGDYSNEQRNDGDQNQTEEHVVSGEHMATDKAVEAAPGETEIVDLTTTEHDENPGVEESSNKRKRDIAEEDGGLPAKKAVFDEEVCL